MKKKIIPLICLSGYSHYKKIHKLLIAAHKNKGHLRRNEKILQHMFIFYTKNIFANVKISVMINIYKELIFLKWL